MKKQELIDMLQQIDGNPEIVVWNGFVNDYMHIENVISSVLSKQTKKHYKELCKFEICLSKNDLSYQLSEDVSKLLDSTYSRAEWEINEIVTEDDLQSGRYKQKKVLIINSKQRGIRTFDRAGGMAY